VTMEDRGQVLALVAEAVAQGSRLHTACEMVGVDACTLQRWQRPQTAEDGRRGPRTAPRNNLSQSKEPRPSRRGFCKPRGKVPPLRYGLPFPPRSSERGILADLRERDRLVSLASASISTCIGSAIAGVTSRPRRRRKLSMRYAANCQRRIGSPSTICLSPTGRTSANQSHPSAASANSSNAAIGQG